MTHLKQEGFAPCSPIESCPFVNPLNTPYSFFLRQKNLPFICVSFQSLHTFLQEG